MFVPEPKTIIRAKTAVPYLDCSNFVSDVSQHRRIPNRNPGQTTGIAILGAVWAARALYYAGANLSAGATNAPASAQAAALDDTFMVSVFLISVALVLGIWALIKERQSDN